VEGYLQEQHFITGRDVKVGDPLFTIEPVQYQAALDMAEALVAASEAERLRAEADLGRVKQAVATNAVSVQEVDLRQADLNKAVASLAAANASVVDAKTLLSYTDIRSPIDGRVGRERVSLGNLVGAGENTLLTTVFSMKPLYVYFDLPEILVVDWLRDNDPSQPVERGDFPMKIALEGEEGFPHDGYVEFVENTVNASTGTVLIRGVLPNEGVTAYPGLFVRVQLAKEIILEDALLVEDVAIGTDLAGKYVLVVGEDSIVERRGVVLGPEVGQLVTVLEGLEIDDEYIVDGIIRARPGRPVQTERR
jgi:RND family efflux transporter MFP subunit